MKHNFFVLIHNNLLDIMFFIVIITGMLCSLISMFAYQSMDPCDNVLKICTNDTGVSSQCLLEVSKVCGEKK